MLLPFLVLLRFAQLADMVFWYPDQLPSYNHQSHKLLENLELLKTYLKVNHDKKHPTFDVKKSHELDVLSESEIEALQETIKKYGHYSGPQLIDLTHREASWKKSEKNREIDYRLFFEGEANARPEALEYLESLREDMEFIFSLTIPS